MAVRSVRPPGPRTGPGARVDGSPSGRAGTRQRVLEAARSLFATSGYRATSMRQIAERVGISKAALYHHFPGKDDILAELTTPVLTDLEAVLAAAERHPDPHRVRWQAIEGFLNVMLEHRATLLMLVRDMTLLVQPPVAERFKAATALANDLVAGPSRGPAGRVRAAQAVAALGDPVILHHRLPTAQLRRLILDGVAALLGDAATDESPRRSGDTSAAGSGDRSRTRSAKRRDDGQGSARGSGRGRPVSLSPTQVTQARSMYESGRYTVDEIARTVGVSRATVYRRLKSSL